mmetsp:Transcript_45840/g.33581  ORF Transcript_45840/g.33581 Transcript_45840/m.33581 type:complete len:182 (-) Transcript_45840:380-925(-)
MSQERRHLHSVSVLEKFGFLFRGYKKQFFYWEIVVMYRKVLLIFIQVFVASFGLLIQALLVFLLLLFFLMLTWKKKPFVNLALNDLEIYSLFASIITIYSSIFFIQDQSSQNSSDQDNLLWTLSTAANMVFFLIIVLINVLFFLYWFYKMFQEMHQMIIMSYEKVYLMLCLCNNRKKLEEI